MKPAPFAFLRPATLEEALAALAGEQGAKVLAGGQSLVPLLSMRLAAPSMLVDINALPDLGHVRVERLVGAFAGGRVVNPLLARSQLVGGMVWGIGQALMEETAMDLRTGMWTNRSLGEALVPTNADVPDVEAILIEEDDTRGHPLGIKGLGEIGNSGTAAAVGNAIFHATGVRLTALPFRVERLMAGTARGRGLTEPTPDASGHPTGVT